jgi:CBS domain-containing protein
LPVVDGQKLVGMISVMDLLRVFVEQDEDALA